MKKRMRWVSLALALTVFTMVLTGFAPAGTTNVDLDDLSIQSAGTDAVVTVWDEETGGYVEISEEENDRLGCINEICVELHAYLFDHHMLQGGYVEAFAGSYIDWDQEALVIAVTDEDAIATYEAALEHVQQNIVGNILNAVDADWAETYASHDFIAYETVPYSYDQLRQIYEELGDQMEQLSIFSVGLSEEENGVIVSTEESQQAYLTDRLQADEAYGQAVRVVVGEPYIHVVLT